MTTYFSNSYKAERPAHRPLSTDEVGESRSECQIPELRDDGTWTNSGAVAATKVLLPAPATDTGAQGQPCRCRPPEQRTHNSTEPYTNLRQILAFVVPPIMNVNAYHRDNVSSIPQNTTDTLYATLEAAFYRIWGHLRQFLQRPDGRQLFALGIDVILILYSFGFLLLAMYEAAIIGQ